jgi:hypothetical protein
VTPEEFFKVQEISRLLKEAYDHYFEYEGYCKSAEGQIEISYGNLWYRPNPYDLKVESIYIYSYVFCREERSKTWNNIDEALEEVRGWHAEEMAYDYNSPEAIENQIIMDRMAGEFLNEMIELGKLTIIEVGDDEDGFTV